MMKGMNIVFILMEDEAVFVCASYEKTGHLELCVYVYGIAQSASDWLRAERSRGRSSSPGRGKIFSSPCRRDRSWSPPSLLSNGDREIFPRE
jgi:hypothetical protein